MDPRETEKGNTFHLLCCIVYVMLLLLLLLLPVFVVFYLVQSMRGLLGFFAASNF